jgi:hypothetical protein
MAVQACDATADHLVRPLALRDKIAQRQPSLHDEETDARHKLRQEKKTRRGMKTAPSEGQAMDDEQNPQQAQHRGLR